MWGRNPALTRWVIIFRPSGPGATAWARVAWFGFVPLVSFVVVQRWRVEPPSAQRGTDWLTQRRKGGKGRRADSIPWLFLASLRLERSGREESVRVGCGAVRRAKHPEAASPAEGRIRRMLQPLRGWFRFPHEPGVRFATPYWLSADIPPGSGPSKQPSA